MAATFAFARVPKDTKNVRLQDVLNPGAVALADKAGCIIGGIWRHPLHARGDGGHVARAHGTAIVIAARELVLG